MGVDELLLDWGSQLNLCTVEGKASEPFLAGPSTVIRMSQSTGLPVNTGIQSRGSGSLRHQMAYSYMNTRRRTSADT